MTRIRLAIVYMLVYYGLFIQLTLGAISFGFALGGKWELGSPFACAAFGVMGFNYGLSLGRANVGVER